MDDAITERVNTCVKPNDTFYFLGDFCIGREEQVIAYVNGWLVKRSTS